MQVHACTTVSEVKAAVAKAAGRPVGGKFHASLSVLICPPSASSPVLRTLLLGTCDEGSPFWWLRGQSDVLRLLCKHLWPFLWSHLSCSDNVETIGNAAAVSTHFSPEEVEDGLMAQIVPIPCGTELRYPSGPAMVVPSAHQGGYTFGPCQECGGPTSGPSVSYFTYYSFCPDCNLRFEHDGGGP